MGNIGTPVRRITIPKPIEAPSFPMPATTPTPIKEPELVPVR